MVKGAECVGTGSWTGRPRPRPARWPGRYRL